MRSLTTALDFIIQLGIGGSASLALKVRAHVEVASRELRISLVDSGTIRDTNDTRSGSQAELALQFSDYLIYIKRHNVAPQ